MEIKKGRYQLCYHKIKRNINDAKLIPGRYDQRKYGSKLILTSSYPTHYIDNKTGKIHLLMDLNFSEGHIIPKKDGPSFKNLKELKQFLCEFYGKNWKKLGKK